MSAKIDQSNHQRDVESFSNGNGTQAGSMARNRYPNLPGLGKGKESHWAQRCGRNKEALLRTSCQGDKYLLVGHDLTFSKTTKKPPPAHVLQTTARQPEQEACLSPQLDRLTDYAGLFLTQAACSAGL